MTWVTVNNPDGSQSSYDDGNNPPPTEDAPAEIPQSPTTNTTSLQGVNDASSYGSGATPANAVQGDNAPSSPSIDTSSQVDPQSYATTLRAMDNATASGVPQGFMSELLSSAKKVFDWAGDTKNQKNPLLQMALTGISNAQNNANKREMAAQQHQYAIDEINQKYANERKTAADNSAAISAIPLRKGIIQGALKRIDGTPVFNPNGTVKA
jgi:hypothetical protein